MSWINDIKGLNRLRNTNYNRCLCLNKANIDYMVSKYDFISDFFINFTDSISSLKVYPFKVPYTESESGYNWLSTPKTRWYDVTVYNLDESKSYVSMGQYFVSPYYNNYADYKGYTYIQLFLPCLGYIDIDVNEVMNKWIQIRLNIDYYSGKGIYIIGVTDNKINLEDDKYPNFYEDSVIRVINTYECIIGIDIPLGSSNAGDIYRNLALGTVKALLTLGVGVYTGSLGAAVTTASTVTTLDISTRSNEPGSRLKPTTQGTITKEKTSTTHRPVNRAKPIADTFDVGIDTLNRMSASGKGDRISDSGLLCNMSGKAKIIIYRPKLVETSGDYGYLYGYPLGDTRKLSELSGYTEVNSIHFEGEGFENITQKEIAMLEETFTNGVIL